MNIKISGLLIADYLIFFLYWTVYIAWFFVIIWTLACTVIALYWVIQFDEIIDARNDSETGSCSNNYDMSAIDWINFNTSQSDVEKILNENPAVFDPPKNDSFGENVTSTNRWLISIAVSYSISVFITGPIIAFILQLKNVLFYKPGKDLTQESSFFSLYVHFI